jgi:hypothetical protein
MLQLLLASLVLTQAKVEPLDLGEARSTMQGLTDGQGHYILYNAARPFAGPLLSGDARALYLNRVIGGGSSGEERWNASFWDPRVPLTGNGRPSVEMTGSGQTFSLVCGLKVLPLTPLAPEALATLLAGARLLPARWTRYPEKLMRDDAGNYFFVDRLRTEDDADRRDFRVFMGPRGKLKPLPLKDIVDDSEGTIFATRNGVLRLITTDRSRGTQVYKWVVGKVETALIDVPVQDNARMIYLDLGPYSGLPLGTPCDPVL